MFCALALFAFSVMGRRRYIEEQEVMVPEKFGWVVTSLYIEK